MKRAILPALIASLFAVNGAFAGDRELLFGPAGIVDDTPPKVAAPKTQPSRKAVAQPVEKAPVDVKVVPVTAKEAAKPASVAQVAPAPVTVKASMELTAAAPTPTPKVRQPKAPQEPSAPVSALLSESVFAAPLKVGYSSFERSRELAHSLKQAIVIGFYASDADQSTAAFLSNFMPLSNHLSESTNVLTTLLPERKLSLFSTAILENRYPVIFTNATMAHVAIEAGYEPVAVAEEQQSAVFLVRSDSPYQTLSDIKGVRVAYAGDTQAAYLGLVSLAKRGVTSADDRLNDLGFSGFDGALRTLIRGAADVVIAGQKDARRAMEAEKGKFRLISADVGAPILTIWIRKDLADSDYARRLKQAAIQIDARGTGSGRIAGAGIQNGLGVRGKFVQPGEQFADDAAELWNTFVKAYPRVYKFDNYDPDKVDENLEIPAIAPNKVVKSNDLFQKREEIYRLMKSRMAVGFFPSGASEANIVSFLENFQPLSNHLSLGSGVLVSFLPERNVSMYSKHIADRRYQAIFINPFLAETAERAGYVPVAIGAEPMRGVFVIKAKSPAQKVEDLRGMKIGFSSNAESALLGLAELAGKGIGARDNYLNDVLDGGHYAALELLSRGAVDVALVRPIDAQNAVDDSQNALRMIDTELSLPASGFWIKKELVGTELGRKLQASILQINGKAQGMALAASEAFARGYGVEGAFVKPDEDYMDSVREVLNVLRKSYPNVLTKASIVEGRASQNAKNTATQDAR